MFGCKVPQWFRKIGFYPITIPLVQFYLKIKASVFCGGKSIHKYFSMQITIRNLIAYNRRRFLSPRRELLKVLFKKFKNHVSFRKITSKDAIAL